MKKYNIVGLIILILGILCISMKALLPETIDANGFLHEHFYLLPIGFFLIFLGILVLIINYVIHRK
ncbi:MAG: DUF3955 domain-containing protein [Clostridia bacterium]